MRHKRQLLKEHTQRLYLKFWDYFLTKKQLAERRDHTSLNLKNPIMSEKDKRSKIFKAL